MSNNVSKVHGKPNHPHVKMSPIGLHLIKKTLVELRQRVSESKTERGVRFALHETATHAIITTMAHQGELPTGQQVRASTCIFYSLKTLLYPAFEFLLAAGHCFVQVSNKQHLRSRLLGKHVVHTVQPLVQVQKQLLSIQCELDPWLF